MIHLSRDAIALLLTVMFVIVISVAIGYSLKLVNKGGVTIQDEMFAYQTSLILEDVLTMLQSSTELQNIADNNNSIEELSLFLSQASVIPFYAEGIDVLIKIKSARSKFNINDLNDSREANYLRQYCNKYMINSEYVTILFDVISGVKEDNSYNSAIFEENPNLYRDGLVSYNHLQKVNDFYTKEFHDNALKNIDFQNLFYFSKEKNSTYVLDLNYATAEVYEMLLGCSKERANDLHSGGGSYKTLQDLGLQEDEKARLSAFRVGFFEPYLSIEVELHKYKSTAVVHFEYDIKKKKGSHFVYKI
jgi:hypothetical protein